MTASPARETLAFPHWDTRLNVPFSITVDHSRDALLTEFGKATLVDRYLMPGETFQTMFGRVACYYASTPEHAQRLYDYISKLWFMPATPILSNGGTSRGLPISCFLNSVGDSLEGINGAWTENAWLAARGGGIGTYWGDVRSIGERVGVVGKTSGVVPFIKVMDSMTLAISQGSLRRGSAAVYLPIDHPEIEEFVDIRRVGGGDPNRRALNLHNGISITDEFMRAVQAGEAFALRSPRDRAIIQTVDARALWIKILTARLETGEPYLLFVDTVNRAIPDHQKLLGLAVKQSNLCSEITLPTGRDHLGNDRTAVCCLSSLNVEFFDRWSSDPLIVEDALRFLDNVLSDFIAKTKDVPGFEKARYSAARERSVGLGVMGLHSYFQGHMIPFESVMAKVWNKRIFSYIKERADEANTRLGIELGACPDAEDAGFMKRFSNMTAVAPTASISIIAGCTSPGIEPLAANSFVQKTLSGSFNVRNTALERLLTEKGRNTPKTWTSITVAGGSVQHLDFLSDDEKAVFRTAMEIDQRWIIELAAERAPLICQAQSVNIFLPSNVGKKALHDLHFSAWQKGLKSLYYCRSASLQRAEVASHMAGTMPTEADRPDVMREPLTFDEQECLACQ